MQQPPVPPTPSGPTATPKPTNSTHPLGCTAPASQSSLLQQGCQLLHWALLSQLLSPLFNPLGGLGLAHYLPSLWQQAQWLLQGAALTGGGGSTPQGATTPQRLKHQQATLAALGFSHWALGQTAPAQEALYQLLNTYHRPSEPSPPQALPFWAALLWCTLAQQGHSLASAGLAFFSPTLWCAKLLSGVLALRQPAMPTLSLLLKPWPQNKTALVQLKRCLRHHPHSAKAWYYLGLFYQQHSQQQPKARHVAKALAALQQACTLAPQHTAAQWALGQLLQQQGQWMEAQTAYWWAWYSPGVQGNKPLQRQVAHQLALLLEAHQQADPQGAEDFALMLALTLKRGGEGRQGTLATHSHLAKLALAQGNQQGQQALGLWHCHQGLRHQPQHLQALLNVAHTAQQAIFYYHRALAALQAQALVGSASTATALRASLYLALGELYATPAVKQPHRALAYLQQAVALDATQPKAYLRLGQAYQQLQQPAQALEALSQAKSLHQAHSQASALGAGVLIEGVAFSSSATTTLATEEVEALNHSLGQLFGQF